MTITRTAALTVTLAAAGAALAGCSTGSPGTPPAAQSVSTVVLTETSGSTTAPHPTITSTTSGTDRCRAAQLAGSLTPAPGGASAGSMHYVLTLTNAGSSSCTTGGYPGVSFVGDGNGSQLGPAARRDGGPGELVTLQPTDSARAALTVAQAANFPDCAPQTADGLRVYPPDDRDSLFVRTSGLTACRSSAVLLTVGPLR